MNILKRISASIFTILLLLCFTLSVQAMQEQTSGSFPALDKKGAPIIINGSEVTLEWRKVTGWEMALDFFQQILPVKAEAFADESLNFLDDTFQVKKEYSVAVTDYYKEDPKALDAQIEAAKQDRKVRVDFTLQIEQQQVEMLKKIVQDQKVPLVEFFAVVAKNKKNEILGFTAFHINPELVKGDVSLESLAIMPMFQGYGLARPLVFSILKIVPDIKRIFLGTNIWLTKAQITYNALGFSVYAQESYGIKFEYLVKNN
ncbi:MAG: GNAT family N-acetyltransferase [bacterium]